LAGFIVVAAAHDTSYQNDAGGIKASSRWLSEATPPVMRSKKKLLAPRPGCKSFLHRVPVVSSLTLLNHRLLAAMPPASSRSKSVINGREEYKRCRFFLKNNRG